jgi:large subunit ribosomal protein L2
MPIKRYKPTTPGRRRSSVDAFSDVTTTTPYKPLLTIKKRTGGRNSYGRITCRHRGGGAKRFLRKVDFKREKFDVPAKVETIEYDPNRNARIALVCYADGERRYIVAPVGLEVGAKILSSQKNLKISVGNRFPLHMIPEGMSIFNIELIPGKGAEMVRSAGTMAQLMAVDDKYAQIKLPSGEVRLVPRNCMATIGQVSNPDFMHIRWGKAGRKRHLGIRPTVRGKAMNPCDHPHGGGEGRSPIGMKAPKTPWGKKALGVKTRNAKKASSKLILKRRKSKKRR